MNGYILVAPYAELRVAVRRRTTRYLGWPLGDIAYGALLFGAHFALPHLDRISPAASAARAPLEVPTLIFAGERDDRAPPSDAQAIAASAADVRVIIAPGADHEDVGEFARSEAGLRSIRQLLDRIALVSR